MVILLLLLIKLFVEGLMDVVVSLFGGSVEEEEVVVAG
jgi:hypothetical protein